MIKRIEEIRIPDDPTEDALVVAEQDEGHLARNGDCGAQPESAPEPREVGCVNHVAWCIAYFTGVAWN
jgi:hypothetical protein